MEGDTVDEALSNGLEREHAEIDRAIESFASRLTADKPPTTVLVGALDELRRHIYFEEELLFPPLQAAGLVPPLFVMRREHGEMWATLDALAARLTSAVEPVDLQDLLGRLAAQLQEHNSKEEMIVYPAAEEMIAAPARGDLIAQLAEVRMPGDWVCQAARANSPASM